MKTMIPCDDVFEALTAGPFPAGKPSDPGIAAHLSTCDECRQLAEALKPACNLLHEALSHEERQGLPAYQDAESLALQKNLTAIMQAIAPPAARNADSPPTRPMPGWSSPWSQRIMGALCVGVCVLLLINGGLPWSTSASSTSGGWRPLESLQLGANCLVKPSNKAASSSVSPTARHDYLCCTSCHTATISSNRGPASAALIASCGNCHTTY